MVASRVRLCAVLLATALVLVAGAACDGGSSSPGATQQPQVTVGPETQNVGIPVEEGDGFVTLRGHLFGPQHKTGVILTHMRPNDQRDWFEFAQVLADNGYAAFTFDFRGYGETGGDQDFDKLDDDVVKAIEYMRSKHMDQIFLIGASMGGTAALVAAAEEPVDGVIAISPPAEFEGLDAVDAVSSITAPKLFVASVDDEEAIGFQDLLDAASKPVDSETYTGNAHGTNLLQSEHGDALRALILQFLQENSSP